ncbi:MAG: modification methylase [Lachnospiraceae bacterium]|nr:modification methylase [Lachnospiraceae bacterium]
MSEKEQIIEVKELPLQIETGASYVIKQANPNTYTHGMFKYPCKFIPEIPRWGLRNFLEDKRQVVFDPFSGSGTTLLEANLQGYDAWGTEIDDIAKLIIKVKTTRLRQEQMGELEEHFLRMLDRIKEEERDYFRPAIDNLEHWFSKKTIGELGRMKGYVDEIKDTEIQNFFQLCMVSIIKKVSNADDTSPKPYVSNKIQKEPPPVEREFSSTYQRYRQMLCQLQEAENLGRTMILEGDALAFSPPGQIDLAITSPPYINAFDYGRTLRLENLWMDLLTEQELRDKKKRYVGTEKIQVQAEQGNLAILNKSSLLEEYYEKILPVDEKRALIVKKFFEDMETNLQCISRHMAAGGKYMIVIGNSRIRKVEVESWQVIGQIASQNGFHKLQHFSYVIQNPYIRIPRKGMGGKIHKDYVLVLEKGE